ncbi:MAG TPA: TfuA-like protein [Burkholderiales bacterium]|nr:TfuA-like protein [Burkholderiales bacterium]
MMRSEAVETRSTRSVCAVGRAGPAGRLLAELEVKLSGRACVFVGPSLSENVDAFEVTRFPPVRAGDLLDAVAAGYKAIGIVDGALDPAERLTLEELGAVLRTPGVTVFGGGSLGALWAAQLHEYGMRGVGRIFRLLRRRAIQDSDELYVLHAPAELGYRPLTLPLINVRFTLRHMRRTGRISRGEEQALVMYLKEISWFDRDFPRIASAADQVCNSALRTKIVNSFNGHYRNAKRDDALAVIAALHRYTS